MKWAGTVSVGNCFLGKCVKDNDKDDDKDDDDNDDDHRVHDDDGDDDNCFVGFQQYQCNVLIAEV